MAANPISAFVSKLAGATPKSDAEKALAASQAAAKRADDMERNNSGYRFTGRPDVQDQVAAQVRKLRQEAAAHQQRYRDLTAQNRVAPKPKNAPTSGKDKGQTGLRQKAGVHARDPRAHGDAFDPKAGPAPQQAPAGPIKKAPGLRERTGVDNPVVDQPQPPKPVRQTRLSDDAIKAHNDEMQKIGVKAQREKTAQSRLDMADLQKLPHAGSLNASERQAHDVAGAMIDKMSKGKGGNKEDDSAKNGKKVDSKPGAGDRRTNDPSGLHKLAVKQGWTEKRVKNGWMLLSPDGIHSVTYHLTQSDHRAAKNMLGELQKGGFRLPGNRSGDMKTDTRVTTPDHGPIPPLPKTGPGSFDQDTSDRNPIPPAPKGTPPTIRVPRPQGTPGYGPGPGGIVMPKPKLPPTGTAGNSGKTDVKSASAALFLSRKKLGK